jgi:hypothetical protein
MVDEEARAEVAALRAKLAKRDHAAISRMGGWRRQESREEDDEPEWVGRAVDIAKSARDADPTIDSKVIVNDRILVRCEGMAGLPKFDMLMKYMARWEAAGRVARKVKMSPSRRRK